MLQACAKCQQIDSPQPPFPPMPEEKPPEDEGQNPNAVYPNPNQQPTFDAGKLHQAILAFRPVSYGFYHCKIILLVSQNKNLCFHFCFIETSVCRNPVFDFRMFRSHLTDHMVASIQQQIFTVNHLRTQHSRLQHPPCISLVINSIPSHTIFQ